MFLNKHTLLRLGVMCLVVAGLVAVMGGGCEKTKTKTEYVYLEPGDPAQPDEIYPADDATDIGLSPNLIWTSAENASTYKVYFGTASGSLGNAVATTPNCAISYINYNNSTLLAYETEYFWKIVAVNTQGNETSSAEFSFTTEDAPVAPPTYCTELGDEMRVPRSWFGSIALNDNSGRILCVGGKISGGIERLRTMEYYDQDNETFYVIRDTFNPAWNVAQLAVSSSRGGRAQTSGFCEMPGTDGNYYVIAGYGTPATYQADCNTITAISGTPDSTDVLGYGGNFDWSNLGSIKVAPITDSTVSASSKRMLFFQGDSIGEGRAYVYTYDPAAPGSGTFVVSNAVDPLTGRGSGDPQDYCVMDDGTILIVGGVSTIGPNAPNWAVIFNPGTDATTNASFTATSEMNYPRNKVTLVPLGNGSQVLCISGYSAGTDNKATILDATCEIYDRLTDTWTEVGALNTARRGFGFVVLDDDRVVVASGADASCNCLDTIEIYDPDDEEWTVVSDPMRYAREDCRAHLLDNGKVIILGGGVPGY